MGIFSCSHFGSKGRWGLSEGGPFLVIASVKVPKSPTLV